MHAADQDRLELSADGPVGFDVRYDLAPAALGAEMTASVAVRRGGGITGRVVAKAAEAMLAAGALNGATVRIVQAAESRVLALAA